MKCWNCKKEIDSPDHYCRYCGKGQGKYVPYYYNPIGIWIMFLCLGPFAVFFVYRSPVLSKKKKFIISAIMLSLGIWLISCMVNTVQEVVNMYTDIMFQTVSGGVAF